MRGTVDVTPYKIAVARGSVLRVDAGAFAALRTDAPKAATLALPSADGGTVELELVRVEVTTPDFKMVTSDSRGEAVPYTPGLHYRGVVKGVRGSLAAVSVFADEVFGIYRTGTETVVIGRLAGDNQPNDHLLYREADLLGAKAFECGSRDDVARDGSRLDPKEFEEFQAFQWETPVETQEILAKCVRIYVEADFDIFQNKGSAANVTNYITAVFNQSATLYANDSVPISLSQVFVWTSTSPYTSNRRRACCRSSSSSATRSTATSATSSPSAAAAASRPASTGSATPTSTTASASAASSELLERADLLLDGRGVHPRDGTPVGLAPHPRLRLERQQHRDRRLLGPRRHLLAAGHSLGRRHHHELLPPAEPRHPLPERLRPAAGQRHPLPLRERVVPDRLRRQPAAPPTCTTYTGSLSGTGASAVQPNGT